jgi:hypothetical protein
VPVRLTSKLSLATLVVAGAATLAGCAGPRPLSFEEKVWFDMATGPDLVRDHYAPLPYPPPPLLPPPDFEPFASGKFRR